jgi:hypothetical protein
MLAIVFMVAGGVAKAQSAAPVAIGTFRRWQAYTADAGSGKMCFAASQPTSSSYKPDNVKSRDPVYFMVTTFQDHKIRDQVSTIFGYSFAKDAKVLVDIDGNKFNLFTQGNTAWIADPAQEPSLVDAIRHGKAMVVQGTSSRGTATVDSYSLEGSKAALAAVEKECPLQ